MNWWDLDSLGQLWFAAENKIGGKYDDWECTKIVMKRIAKIIRQNGQSIELQKNNVDHRSNVRSKGLVNEVQDYKSKDLRSKKN